jgi:signal transduction histidine kinase
MFKSLWVKFLLLLFSVCMVSLSAALFLREMIISDFEEYLEGKAEDQIYRLLAATEGSYEKNGGWNEDALEENAVWALLLGYKIKITDVRDNELIDTKKAIESLPPLMKKRIIAVSGFSPEENPPDRKAYTTYPLFLGGKDIGFLQIRPMIFEEGQRKETIFMMRSNRFLVISLFFLGGLSVLLSLFFSRRLTEPIKRLTMAAEQISRGNIKSRVAVAGNSEISTLSKTFNTMANNLEIQESLRRKMTSNVAHELRTPLSAMQGEIEGMLDGLMKVDRERLLSLHEETERLKHIVEGMEELSRAEASVLEMRKQSIDLKPFLNNIKGRFEKLFFDKGVDLELECDETMRLYADPDKLSQIVINLLSNALRVTDKGGHVRIKTGIKDPDGYISVSDTGCGIKKEDLPFIFERFYKSSEGGLGIGLTIAKELAEAHGGRIEVSTEYEKGSTFTLFLPDFTISS